MADEREHVLFYLVEILYRVVPLFYEEIEAALARAFAVPIESIEVPGILRFGSRVGGDMDGNADVHGKTVRETLFRHQQFIVSTYFDECGQLAEALSQSANRVDRERRPGGAHRVLHGAAAGRAGIRAGASRSDAVPHILRSNRRAAEGDLRRPTQCLSEFRGVARRRATRRR